MEWQVLLLWQTLTAFSTWSFSWSIHLSSHLNGKKVAELKRPWSNFSAVQVTIGMRVLQHLHNTLLYSRSQVISLLLPFYLMKRKTRLHSRKNKPTHHTKKFRFQFPNGNSGKHVPGGRWYVPNYYLSIHKILLTLTSCSALNFGKRMECIISSGGSALSSFCRATTQV